MPAEAINKNDPALVTGVNFIDSQHAVLIDCVNRVLRLTDGDRADRLEELRLLLTWTRYHFAAEEELLVRAGYPLLSVHHEEHERFLKTLAAFNRDYVRGTRDIDEPLLEYCSGWTRHHIENDDRGFSRWMEEHGIPAEIRETGGRACPPFVDPEEVRGVTGIPLVDGQHAEMVRLLNWVRCSSADPAHKRFWLANRLRVLYFYTRYHFLTEEVIHRRSGFPLAEEHKVQHEELMARARDFIGEFTHGREELTEGILNFFRAWTLQHILVEDSRMKGLRLPEGFDG